MNDDISKAVSIFRTATNLDDYAMYQALVADGVDAHRAARLVEFLPVVYCRLILQNSGARFSHTFRRTLPGGQSQEQPLSSEPIWNEIVEFANAEVEHGVSGQDLLAVGARSAEFDAANQLLNKGTQLENIVFAAPVLKWPENGPDPSANFKTSEKWQIQ
jgi:hypothetical protein